MSIPVLNLKTLNAELLRRNKQVCCTHGKEICFQTGQTNNVPYTLTYKLLHNEAWAWQKINSFLYYWQLNEATNFPHTKQMNSVWRRRRKRRRRRRYMLDIKHDRNPPTFSLSQAIMSPKDTWKTKVDNYAFQEHKDKEWSA